MTLTPLHFLLALTPILTACAAMSPHSEGRPLSPTSETAAYPNIEIRDEKGGSCVYWDKELIVELRENRYLRFRATPLNEQWVGSERRPADLCWAYADPLAKGIEVLSVSRENHPEDGAFSIVVNAKKPKFKSAIRIELKGLWMPGAAKFKYALSLRLECPLERWYENSTYAQNAYKSNPKSRPWIEALDYHIEHISMPDRNLSKNPKTPQMYEWFVQSDDGSEWLKSPKVHIPFPIRPGKYVTIHGDAHNCKVGAEYGFLDKERGGWMTRVEKSPVPISYGLCWYFFDVHVQLPGAIPPRHTSETLSLDFALNFEPVDGQRAHDIIGKAKEIEWRNLDAYQLPLFTRDNRFDKLICELPGEDTANNVIWWASSKDCYRDDTTGYDDKYSVTIKRSESSPIPVAWNTYTWGRPFEAKSTKGRRYRFSAMVKLDNCTGPVRLARASGSFGDIFYGTRTHNSDGTPITEKITWQFSEPLSGTRDWTPVSIEFTVRDSVNSLILEQYGSGQSWFDNVKIEDLGEPPKSPK